MIDDMYILMIYVEKRKKRT